MLMPLVSIQRVALMVLLCVATPGTGLPTSVPCIQCPSNTCRVNCAHDLGILNDTSVGQCVPCQEKHTIDDVVHVDINVPPVSSIPSLHSLKLGLNAISGTWCPCWDDQRPCTAGPFNATDDIVQLNPSLVRTHDTLLLDPLIYQQGHVPWGVRVLNWNNMFPDLQADPHNTSNYNFSNADRWMEQWDNLGIPRLLRLGTSVNQGTDVTNITSMEVETLSEAFLHFVMHFNDGWGGGNRNNNTLKIQYIEVWNEPEGKFWSGSTETLHLLLYKTIHKIRAYDETLYVGPNNACPYGDCTNDPTHSDEGYEFDALDAIIASSSNVSLLPNIYSWHEYIYQNPMLTNRLFGTVANRLSSRNVSTTQQIITEWNPCADGACGQPEMINAWAAADFGQTVAVHSLLGVNVSMPYPLCAVNKDWGLLSTAQVDAHTLFWRPQAHAFQMMADVLTVTPYSFQVQLFPTFSSNVSPYFGVGYVNANRTQINVVYASRMSNVTQRRQQVLVSLKGFKSGDAFNVSCFVIDDYGGSQMTAPRSNVQIGSTETIRVGMNGTIDFPHSYPGRTPSLMQLKIVQLVST